MENNLKKHKSFSEMFLPFYNKAINALLNKALYLTITITLLLSSTSLWTYDEIGQTIYLTLPYQYIGNKPGRLWGLLSIVRNMNMTQIRICVILLTLITTLCAAFPLYLFIKDIRDDRNKIFAVFGVGFVVMMLLFGYDQMEWEYMSLALYISMMLICWSAYFLHKTEKRFIAVLFAVTAMFVDCRALLLLLPVVFLTIFVKAIHKDNKKLKLMNILVLLAAATAFIISFVFFDFDYEADTGAIDEIFTERFLEYGYDKEDIDKAMWTFKFEAYKRVSPPELISDSFTNAYQIKDIVYEDGFQLFIFLLLTVIILYDRKSDYKEDSTISQPSEEPVPIR